MKRKGEKDGMIDERDEQDGNVEPVDSFIEQFRDFVAGYWESVLRIYIH